MATKRKGSAIYGDIPRVRKEFTGERWKPPQDSDWDPDLPYGGKVYMARKKKPMTLKYKIMEGLFILAVFGFCLYSYYYFENLHFHSLRAVAYMGHPNSQHFTAQRYLNGKGVEKHEGNAMYWFEQAANQGHPHASHNLAVGHLKGMVQLEYGKAHQLIEHAAMHGIEEAQEALDNACQDQGCY